MVVSMYCIIIKYFIFKLQMMMMESIETRVKIDLKLSPCMAQLKVYGLPIRYYPPNFSPPPGFLGTSSV
jgi:hypothetical protein